MSRARSSRDRPRVFSRPDAGLTMKAARMMFSGCYSSVPLGNPRDRGMLMSTRSVGLLLGLALIIAIGTLVQDFRFDSLIARERDAALAADREFGGIETSLASLRTAQAGYVALGQAPASWATRAAELFTQIETLVAARRSASRLTDADAQYGAVTQSLAALARIDRQAQAAVSRDDRYPASDLVFMDAADAASKVNDAVVKVRAAEAQASSDHTRRLAMLRLIMNGAAVGAGAAHRRLLRASRASPRVETAGQHGADAEGPPAAREERRTVDVDDGGDLRSAIRCRADRAVSINRRAEINQPGGRSRVMRGSRASARRPRRARPARTDGHAVRRQGCRALGCGHRRRPVAAHAVPRLLGQGAGEAETPAGRFGQRDFPGLQVPAAPVHQWRVRG